MKLVETQGDSLSQDPKLEKVTGLNVKVAKRKSDFSLTVGLIFLFLLLYLLVSAHVPPLPLL